MKKFNFPIRFKILFALLVVITTVVSIITFIMANMFNADKQTYVRDLTSVIASHTAAEVETILHSYRNGLQTYGSIMTSPDIYTHTKSELLTALFRHNPSFLAVSLYRDNKEQATIYDSNTLKLLGVTKDDLLDYRRENPLPLDNLNINDMFIANSTTSESLPKLTMALPIQTVDNEKVALVAIIRLDEGLKLASRTGIFDMFVIDSNQEVLLHSDPDYVLSKSAQNWLPKEPLEQLGLTDDNMGNVVVTEYIRNAEEIIASFMRLEFGNMLISVQIPKSAAYLTARELLSTLMWVSLVLLAISAILSLIWSGRLTKPLEKLSKAVAIVGKGRFDVEIDVDSRDEIGLLSGSFNQMTSELKTREEALNQAQAALVQSEKMAAFGQIGAGIAHEVKNPLAGILGSAQLALRKVSEDEKIHKHLSLIEKETKRCRNIIDNLMKFARQEESSKGTIDVNMIISDATEIVDHQLTINHVTLEKDLSENLLPIYANANQIQQVLMNFMINAQQAMNGEPGTVSIRSRQLDERSVEVRVEDTGPGMSEEVRNKIFEPFYTTKPAGQGTGLGLSVSFGIIKDHKGEIRVESEPGHGAKFIITLPIAEANIDNQEA